MTCIPNCAVRSQATAIWGPRQRCSLPTLESIEVTEGSHNHDRDRTDTGLVGSPRGGNVRQADMTKLSLYTNSLIAGTYSFFYLPLLNSTSSVEWHEQLRVFQHKRANIWSCSIINLFSFEVQHSLIKLQNKCSSEVVILFNEKTM